MLNTILDLFDIIDVNKSSITSYSQIDAYSQRINPNFETFSFESARNMGKNDLWIASLAALLNLKLVTTDSDFDHINNVFIEVRKINPLDFVRFFLSIGPFHKPVQASRPRAGSSVPLESPQM